MTNPSGDQSGRATGGGDDDALRQRLLAADPAWRQVPLTDDEVKGYVQTVRTAAPPANDVITSGAPSGPSRGWLYVAAAMVLLGGVGWFISIQSPEEDDDAPGASQPAPPAPSDGQSGSTPANTIELELSPQPRNLRCAPPSADLLRLQDTAFAGTVTGIEGGQATLTVDEIFKGQAATDAVVEVPPTQGTTVYAVELAVGKKYLISATDGRVSRCGLSDTQSPALRDLYVQAY